VKMGLKERLSGKCLKLLKAWDLTQMI